MDFLAVFCTGITDAFAPQLNNVRMGRCDGARRWWVKCSLGFNRKRGESYSKYGCSMLVCVHVTPGLFVSCFSRMTAIPQPERGLHADSRRRNQMAFCCISV